LQNYHQSKTERTETEHVLFADAVHFLHNVHPGCLWAKRGRRPGVCANAGRSRYSVLGAYSAVDGQYVDVATQGSVNALTVLAWIDRLEAAFPEAERITVYVDNARYFHARLVKAHLVGKRVRLVYLPPYSPNLNLIERLWKFCKKRVLCRFYPTFAQFTQAIDAFFADLGRYAEELATLMTDNFQIFTCR
jgi:transposase